jgi:hypothetical protein
MTTCVTKRMASPEMKTDGEKSLKKMKLNVKTKSSSLSVELMKKG